jgi:hypothetical protein
MLNIRLVIFLWMVCCGVSIQTVLYAQPLQVPGEFPTIQEAVNEAADWDTILLAPGIHRGNVLITKPVLIASQFILTGLESAIYETIVDGNGRTVFGVNGPFEGAVTMMGLTIRNGEDGIMASAPVNLYHNLITLCEDGIDYETGGGGTIRHNVFRENKDDGIDLDGTLLSVIIENNQIYDNEDDGIEIRLHSYTGDSSFCRISENQIYRNQEDGIQFIDYPDLTPRVYVVERNVIFDNSMAGIGCMDQGDTREDYRGADIPEPIYLFNNTISGHQYGITGGANLISVNNLIINSEFAGALNSTGNSIHAYCLFHQNTEDLVNANADTNSCIFLDPQITPAFYPISGSPCIEGGTSLYMVGSDTVLFTPEEQFEGEAPDIGAVEYRRVETLVPATHEIEILLKPNPFSEYLSISTFNTLSDGSVRILDQRGRIVEQHSWNGSDLKLRLGYLNKGIYFVVYTGSRGAISRKLIKI